MRAIVGIVLGVVGCGGSGGHPDAGAGADARHADAAAADARTPDAALPDAFVPLPDGPGSPDAAASSCLMASTYDRDFDNPPDGTIDVLSLGTVTTPIELVGQLVDLDGDGIAETNAVAIIGVLNGLPGEEVITANHGIQFVLTDGLGMFTAPNNFANAPVPNATNLDGGDTCGGCMEAWGGWADGSPIDLTTATQVYLTDAGTLTITQFNPGLAAGNTSLIAGSYNNLAMTGYDPIVGVPLDPPCTTGVTELDFAFSVSWPTPTAAPVHTHVRGIDWSKAPRIPLRR